MDDALRPTKSTDVITNTWSKRKVVERKLHMYSEYYIWKFNFLYLIQFYMYIMMSSYQYNGSHYNKIVSYLERRYFYWNVTHVFPLLVDVTWTPLQWRHMRVMVS